MTDLAELTAISPISVTVAISVSEPDVNELIRLGLSELHVRNAFIEIVRHILARGSSIAYGGDLRKAGYTEALFDLVRTYELKDRTGPERVFSYLAWPNWEQLTPGDRAALANVATINQVERPSGAPDLPPDRDLWTAEQLLWGSQALTAMRQQMTAKVDARVILGGRLEGQQGLYPGYLKRRSSR